ncbi:MAG: hypothetical protein CL458_08680 [Acidimicrobiaceae bacterium]|nr:hypothetical protein [Acidimicrobiaceae bacterium]|tara:strand:- start:5103 stop:6257 length:1155 start_codon:yes stop_codon:yes gene_type:complete
MVQYAEGAFGIDPDAVAHAEFTHVFRGYSIDEVRSFLEDVGSELHRLKRELAEARIIQEADTNSPQLTKESEGQPTASVRPGTVIDLQSHRLTIERQENFDDFDSDTSTDLYGEEERHIVPFPSAAPPQRRAVIDELFARLGPPQLDDVEWAKEVLIRTGEIPAVAQSPYESLHGEAETIADPHDRLRRTVTELSRSAVGQLKRNLATRLESLLPDLRTPPPNHYEMSHLVPRAMDDDLVEGFTPFVAAAAKFGAGGIPVNVDGIPSKVARTIGDWLRDRLEAHLDDDVAIEVRLRAVYREWKKSAVDLIATDAIAEAFALGLYVTIPQDAQIKWEMPADGCCGDICHTNGLASIRGKGEEFPSGHLLPPVGPGCRSLVVPAGQ